MYFAINARTGENVNLVYSIAAIYSAQQMVSMIAVSEDKYLKSSKLLFTLQKI